MQRLDYKPLLAELTAALGDADKVDITLHYFGGNGRITNARLTIGVTRHLKRTGELPKDIAKKYAGDATKVEIRED